MSDPVRTLKPGQSVVAERYAPYLLSTISNRFSWGASSLYLGLFDIGMNEWRVLSALLAAGLGPDFRAGAKSPGADRARPVHHPDAGA